MIFDSINRKEHYQSSPLLFRALEFLSEVTPDHLPQPGTVLIPGVLFCNPVTLMSKPEADCIYEAHENYADLHYIVSGTEGIATADVSSLAVTTPYDPEKDILFLSGAEDGRYYLKPGQFMVCFPSDAHKVAIMKDTPEEIVKVVFKIRAAEL